MNRQDARTCAWLNPERQLKKTAHHNGICLLAWTIGAQWLALLPEICVAEESSAETSSAFSYGKQGLQYDDGTGNNFLWFGVRVQGRWSNSRVTQDELPGAPVSSDSEIALNRGRLKLGGHLISPDFTIYSEYDFVDNRLLAV